MQSLVWARQLQSRLWMLETLRATQTISLANTLAKLLSR